MPNPFNPSTTIHYQLPASGHVILKVYDMLGREIAELVNVEKDSGIYTVDFDGSSLSSGTYIYSLKVNEFSQSR
ncbi:MAG: T9SS type A sorting domain-containing protein, partial [Bacteroidetes bacterium]|nr:T9SS type A sorting domain-containing protein [Bacteroidota bacterium]